jgi:hypothetical protein
LRSGLAWAEPCPSADGSPPRSRRGTCRGRSGSRHRTKDDLNPHLVQVFIQQVDDLFESFLANRGLGLSKKLVLPLNHGTPHCPFARLVPFQAFLQRDVEEQDDARHLILPRQVQQVLAGLQGEGGGVHHAEAIQAEPLLDQEMNEGEGLSLIPLVALVVANAPAGPVRGDDLRGAELVLREGGLAAGRRSAKDHDGRSDQTEGLLRALG